MLSTGRTVTEHASLKQIEKRPFDVRHNMDSSKAKKLRKKRNSEREKADASKKDECETDTMSQEETSAQSGQKKKKKRKLNDISNNATTDINVINGDSNGNVKALSKRQLKKKKAAQAEIEERESRKVHAMQKAHNYILMWKYSRSEWKFEKLKQIWLMDNLMDRHSIPNKMFPVVLEYFKDCKGMAREVLVQKAMEIIRKAEEEEDEELKEDILKSTGYNRARELLQILPHGKEL